MKKSILLKLAVALSLPVLIFAVSIAFIMKTYHLTFFEAINKIAVKANIIAPNERLISYSKKYDDPSLKVSISNEWPRLFNYLGKDVTSFEAKIQAKTNVLIEHKLYDANCEKLPNILFCNEIQNTNVLARKLLDFPFEQPQEVGTYGNGWKFAVYHELLMARTQQITKENKLRLNAKLVSMLDSYLFKLDGESASLFHGRSVLASNAILLASQLTLSTEKEQELIDRAYGHFNDFYQAFQTVEIWPEGYSYWINERAIQVVLALQAFKGFNQQNTQLTEDINQLLTNIGLWHIYNTRPDWKIQGWGDEGPRTDLKDETSKVIDFIANVTNDSAIDRYAHLLKLRFGGTNYYRGYKWLLPITFNTESLKHINELGNKPNTNITLAEFDGILPTTKIFGKDFSNHIVVKSDWGKDSTFIQFRASNRATHHQHFDAGAFTLFKETPIATNSSTYHGIFTENRLYYSGRSIAKNTLKISSNDEEFTPTPHYKINSRDGGQRIPLPTHSSIYSFDNLKENLFSGYNLAMAQLEQFEYRPKQYTLIKADITRAYNSVKYSSSNAKVTRVIRTLLYLNKSDSLLIKDTIAVTNKKYQPTWVLHMPNRPDLLNKKVLLGDEFDGILNTRDEIVLLTGNNYKTYIHTLLPSSVAKNLIGGLSYKHYVDGNGDLNQLNGRIFNLGYDQDKWNDTSDWRLEITPNLESEQYELVNLIEINKKSDLNSWVTYNYKKQLLSINLKTCEAFKINTDVKIEYELLSDEICKNDNFQLNPLVNQKHPHILAL